MTLPDSPSKFPKFKFLVGRRLTETFKSPFYLYCLEKPICLVREFLVGAQRLVLKTCTVTLESSMIHGCARWDSSPFATWLKLFIIKHHERKEQRNKCPYRLLAVVVVFLTIATILLPGWGFLSRGPCVTRGKVPHGRPPLPGQQAPLTLLGGEGQLPRMQCQLQGRVLLSHKGLQVQREGHDVLPDLQEEGTFRRAQCPRAICAGHSCEGRRTDTTPHAGRPRSDLCGRAHPANGNTFRKSAVVCRQSTRPPF